MVFHNELHIDCVCLCVKSSVFYQYLWSDFSKNTDESVYLEVMEDVCDYT